MNRAKACISMPLLAAGLPDIEDLEGLLIGGLDDEVARAQSEKSEPENAMPEEIVRQPPHHHPLRVVGMAGRLTDPVLLDDLAGRNERGRVF